MKKIGLLLCFIFLVGISFAQDVRSYFESGNDYFYAENYSQAISYYKKANVLAGGNHSGCQFNIGLCYDLIEDYTQAVYWYRKAAEQDVADAQYNLGGCFYEGKGVTKDYTQAVYWYRKAAEQGDAAAQN
ncbi:MAG: sel1 repeat family protein, partial [Alistipes sp.]|nr:sel1 repeat family protein [Alistipes sp.]